MDHKTFMPQVKEADQGKALVVFATMDVKDKDGDVSLKGLFGEQHAVVVGAHDWKQPTIGKARVFEKGNEALAELTFNLETSAGREWFASIKFDVEHPPVKQQYSYGFSILPGGSKSGDWNGETVRFLQPLENGSPGVIVHEVSPVLLGAGEGTRTLAAKEGRSFEDELADVIERAEAIVAMRKGDVNRRGRILSADRITKIHELTSRLEALVKPEPSGMDGMRLLGDFERIKFDLAHLARS